MRSAEVGASSFFGDITSSLRRESGVLEHAGIFSLSFSLLYFHHGPPVLVREYSRISVCMILNNFVPGAGHLLERHLTVRSYQFRRLLGIGLLSGKHCSAFDSVEGCWPLLCSHGSLACLPSPRFPLFLLPSSVHRLPCLLLTPFSIFSDVFPNRTPHRTRLTELEVTRRIPLLKA